MRLETVRLRNISITLSHLYTSCNGQYGEGILNVAKSFLWNTLYIIHTLLERQNNDEYKKYM